MGEAITVEAYTVDLWPDGTAGWRCLRDDCGRYAGPYGSVVTAGAQAGWHQSKCHKTAGQG